jgi:hypothetical protein
VHYVLERLKGRVKRKRRRRFSYFLLLVDQKDQGSSPTQQRERECCV